MHRLAAASRHLEAATPATPGGIRSSEASSEAAAQVPVDAEAQYAELGYFVVRQLLPADAVQRVHAEVGRILSGYAHGNSDGYVRDYTRSDGRGGTPGAPGELDGPASVRVVRDPRCQSSVLWRDWLTHPNVSALQRRMLGEDVRVMGTSFFTKAPGGLGEATPLHQDLYLWSPPGGPQQATALPNASTSAPGWRWTAWIGETAAFTWYRGHTSLVLCRIKPTQTACTRRSNATCRRRCWRPLMV